MSLNSCTEKLTGSPQGECLLRRSPGYCQYLTFLDDGILRRDNPESTIPGFDSNLHPVPLDN